jgi:hypothetical protein
VGEAAFKALIERRGFAFGRPIGGEQEEGIDVVKRSAYDWNGYVADIVANDGAENVPDKPFLRVDDGPLGKQTVFFYSVRRAGRPGVMRSAVAAFRRELQARGVKVAGNGKCAYGEDATVLHCLALDDGGERMELAAELWEEVRPEVDAYSGDAEWDAMLSRLAARDPEAATRAALGATTPDRREDFLRQNPQRPEKKGEK